MGVWIRNDLKPSDHCTKTAFTASKVWGSMARSVLYRDIKIWPKLYMTYVRPYLEYASPAWSPWLERDCQALEKVQDRSLRKISSLNHLSYNEKLCELNMTTLKERRDRADLCQLWKILHGYDDIPEETWFIRAHEVNQRATRHTASPYNLQEQRSNIDSQHNF